MTGIHRGGRRVTRGLVGHTLTEGRDTPTLRFQSRPSGGAVALNADGGPPSGKTAMLTLAERPLAGVAVAPGKPDAKKYLFTNSAGNPRAVIQNLLLVIVATVERACIYCLYAHEFSLTIFTAKKRGS